MNVPQLRFSGFDGEWDRVTLGDVVKSLNYGMNASAKPYDGENRYIRITDIDESSRRYIENGKVSPDGKLTSDYLIQEGDILFTRTGASTGKSYMYRADEGKMYYAGFLIRARVKEEYDYRFIYFQTLRKEYNKWVKIMSMRSGQPGINAAEYARFEFKLPLINEQRKIANFFMLIDKKIEKQQEKIGQFEQFKTGILQKIFYRELWFKDEGGRSFPEWEEKLIGDFLSESRIIGSKGDKANKLTVKLWGKGVIAKHKTIQGSVNTQYYTRNAGQLMYGKLDFLNCAFGIVPSEFGGYESTLDSPAFDIKNIDPRFLLEYITRKEFYLKYGSQANGSRRAKRIHPEIFFEMPIFVPSLEEQNKVGSFLNLLDRKVDLEKEKLLGLEEQKKGLIQELFV